MTKIYEDDKRSLEQELETKEQRLQREVSNKRRLEKHMHSVVRDTKLKCEKECVSYSLIIKSLNEVAFSVLQDYLFFYASTFPLITYNQWCCT